MKVLKNRWDPNCICEKKNGLGSVESREIPRGKCDVIHVASIEALVQYIGYLKYVSNGPVLFRGQDKLHDSYVPLPSILRVRDTQSAAQEMQSLVEMTGVWNSEEGVRVELNPDSGTGNKSFRSHLF